VLGRAAVELVEQGGQVVEADGARDERAGVDGAVGEGAHGPDEVGVRVGEAADDGELAALPVAVRHLRAGHRVPEQGESAAAADQLGAGLEQRGGAGAFIEDVRPQPVGQLEDVGAEGVSGFVDVGEAEAAGGLAPRLHGFDDDDGSGAGVAGVLGGELSLLQKNVLNRQRWHSRQELRLAIVTWIERTYHRRRRQRRLGRLIPVEFEIIN
jgi:hypothetical protein